VHLGCFIKLWLDPVLQQKIHFIKNFNELNQLIDKDYLSDLHFIASNNHEKHLFKYNSLRFLWKTKSKT
jgi:hypothetical protein